MSTLFTPVSCRTAGTGFEFGKNVPGVRDAGYGVSKGETHTEHRKAWVDVMVGSKKVGRRMVTISKSIYNTARAA